MVREWRFDEYVIVDANIGISSEGFEGTVLVDRAIWPPIDHLKKVFPIVIYPVLGHLWYRGQAHAITSYLLEIRSELVVRSISGILGAIVLLNCPDDYSSSIKRQAETYDKIRNGEYNELLDNVYSKYNITGYDLF